jgi:uncharacterized membrane protein SirB2
MKTIEPHRHDPVNEGATMLERFHRLATNRQTFVVLLLAAVAFFLIGNIGGKNGNPSWLLAPVCLLLMIVLGVDAFIQSRRKQAGSR